MIAQVSQVGCQAGPTTLDLVEKFICSSSSVSRTSRALISDGLQRWRTKSRGEAGVGESLVLSSNLGPSYPWIQEQPSLASPFPISLRRKPCFHSTGKSVELKEAQFRTLGCLCGLCESKGILCSEPQSVLSHRKILDIYIHLHFLMHQI